jgi:hypothetical protein
MSAYPGEKLFETLRPHEADIELLNIDQRAKLDGYEPKTRRYEFVRSVSGTVYVSIFYRRGNTTTFGDLLNIDYNRPGEMTVREATQMYRQMKQQAFNKKRL